MVCIWWDQKSVVNYELLKGNEAIIAVCYQEQLVGLSQPLKEKYFEYVNRHDKMVFRRDNVRPHIA